MANVTFSLLFVLLIVQTNTLRLIYRAPFPIHNTAKPPETATANMIAAPPNCNSDEKLDQMNRCRKVRHTFVFS